MHAFDVLGDPVRRRILELLADGESTSGAVTGVIQREFGITQPAVSAQLRVLREAGFTTVRPQGARRLYAVNPNVLRDVDDWLARFRRFWTPALDALETEIARGRRQKKEGSSESSFSFKEKTHRPSGDRNVGSATESEASQGTRKPNRRKP